MPDNLAIQLFGFVLPMRWQPRIERFTYSRQLERLLRRKWRVDIVNAGFDGAQSEGVVRIARHMIPQTQPDPRDLWRVPQ